MHRTLIMVITSFLIFSTVQAAEFTEGDHYLKIKGEITEKKEISEFFFVLLSSLLQAGSFYERS